MILVKIETPEELEKVIGTVERHGCEAVILGDEKADGDCRVVLMQHISCGANPCFIPFFYHEEVLPYNGGFAHPEEFLCAMCVVGHSQRVHVSTALGQKLILLDQGQIDSVDALPASSCEACRMEIICDFAS